MTSIRVEGICFDLALRQAVQLSNQNRWKEGLFFILELNGSICRFLYIKNFPKKKLCGSLYMANIV